MKTPFLSALLLTVALAGCATNAERTGSGATTVSDPATAGPKIPVLKELAGTDWALVELGGQSAGPAVEGWPLQSLAFGKDGQSVTGHAGVNRFGGRYSEEGVSVVFGPLAMTRRAGPAAQMEIEARYTAVLSRAVSWRQEGASLVLQTPGSKRAALFAPAAKAK